MNRNAFIFALIALTMLLSDVRAQSAIEAPSKDPIAAGFANTVSDLLARMQGEWRIKSATLMGATISEFPMIPSRFVTAQTAQTLPPKQSRKITSFSFKPGRNK